MTESHTPTRDFTPNPSKGQLLDFRPQLRSLRPDSGEPLGEHSSYAQQPLRITGLHRHLPPFLSLLRFPSPPLCCNLTLPRQPPYFSVAPIQPTSKLGTASTALHGSGDPEYFVATPSKRGKANCEGSGVSWRSHGRACQPCWSKKGICQQSL